MKIEFSRATFGDVNDLIQVQNQSFYLDYLKYGECPGYNHSQESMTNIVLNRTTYKILCDEKIVGDIIIRDNGNGDYYLGGLCVIPQHENNGIEKAAMKFIESQLLDANHWSLETPADKERNHYFYQNMDIELQKSIWLDL